MRLLKEYEQINSNKNSNPECLKLSGQLACPLGCIQPILGLSDPYT